MKIFTNVQAMKDAILRAGQLVETKGYYSPGDGGGGRYLIQDTATVDGYVDHELAGGTFAVLLFSGMLDARCAGVLPSSTEDYSDNLNSALQAGLNVFIPDGEYYVTDILIPHRGGIEGQSSGNTILYNTSLSNSLIKNDSSTSANERVSISKLTLVAMHGATADTISIYNFEHLDFCDVNVTTRPGERSLSAGIKLERTSLASRGYYINTTGTVKVDKHEYGVYLLGGATYNINANALNFFVTNDNTKYGIYAKYCTGLCISGGSRELNEINIVFENCSGCSLIDGYSERPDTSQVLIKDSAGCSVDGMLFGSSGNVTAVGSCSVEIVNSDQSSIRNNYIFGSFTTYDVIIDAASDFSLIVDNFKKDRVNGLTVFGVEIQDGSSTTKAKNVRKTSGGSVLRETAGGMKEYVGELVTRAGKELSISETGAKIYAGAVLPEGNVVADRGSIFLRTNGGAGYTFYVKEADDGLNTGWSAK